MDGETKRQAYRRTLDFSICYALNRMAYNAGILTEKQPENAITRKTQ